MLITSTGGIVYIERGHPGDDSADAGSDYEPHMIISGAKVLERHPNRLYAIVVGYLNFRKDSLIQGIVHFNEGPAVCNLAPGRIAVNEVDFGKTYPDLVSGVKDVLVVEEG